MNKEILREKLFFLSYGLYLVISILGESFYFQYFEGTLNTLLLVLCVIILCGSESLYYEYYGYTKKELLLLLLFGYLICTGLFIIKDAHFSLLLMYVVCSKHISFVKIMRMTCFFSVITFGIIFTSAMCGIIENHNTTIFGEIGVGVRERQYLGFTYSLYPPVLMANITLLVIGIYQKKIKYKSLMVLGALNYAMLFLTGSKLAPILSMLFLLIMSIAKCSKYRLLNNVYFRVTALITPVLCGVLSIVCTINFNPDDLWQSFVNMILEGRLLLGKTALEEYGISFFGKAITFIGNGLNASGQQSGGVYNYVDCVYVQFLLKHGLLITGILIVLFIVVFRKLYKNNEYIYMLILMFIAAHAMIDDLVLQLNNNTFWFLFSYALFKRNDGETWEKKDSDAEKSADDKCS